MVETSEVLPNEIAKQRTNNIRLLQGRPPSFEYTPPMSGEVVAKPSLTSQPAQSPSVPQALQPSAGPGSVDNSLLAAFPPIRSQGGIGSCSAFSATYLVGTHMLALVRGSNTKSDSDNSNKLSPKFTYSIANWGKDEGSWISDILNIMVRFGVPSWQNWAYTGDASNPKNYREWPTQSGVWREAVTNRFDKTGKVSNIATAEGLKKAKELLANGYLLLFSTDIIGWQYTKFKDDPATTFDDRLKGKDVCWMVANKNSGHSMAIVGYDDAAWVDINNNNIVDNGEKGAFKIANSWGTGWGDGGFAWISYDALKVNSAVKGANNSGRIKPKSGEFWLYPIWSNEVYWITAKPAYSPTVLAEFTVKHSSRDQLRMRIGNSKPNGAKPEKFSTNVDFNSHGGPWAFDGGSQPVDCNFVFDFSEFFNPKTLRYFIDMEDKVKGAPGTLLSYKLTAPGGPSFSQATKGTPATIDKKNGQSLIDFGGPNIPQLSPPKKLTGRVGQPFSFGISSKNSATSFAAVGLPPGLKISNGGVLSGIPKQDGSFTTAISASNGSGTGVAGVVIEIAPSAKAVPQITSAPSTSGEVGKDLNFQISASNNPKSFSARGLPAGLSLNSQTGSITGKPQQTGVSSVTISVLNEGGESVMPFTITIQKSNQPLPQITSATTTKGAPGSPFTYRINAAENTAHYDAVGLPPGLQINHKTGVISGILPSARVYDITVTAKNEFGTTSQPLVLNVSGNGSNRPINDNFSRSSTIIGPNCSVIGSNFNATMEPGEGSSANQGARSVWWSWTSPRNAKVVISTGGSSLDTVLSVYAGDKVDKLQLIGTNDNAEPNTTTSRVEFLAELGKTYRFAVDGSGGNEGDILLSVKQDKGQPPANDNFQNAQMLAGNVFQSVGSNLDATSEENEAQHMGQPASKSVWWSWTAPANGHVKVDTVGSAFDTVLAVYQNLLRSEGKEIQIKGTADFVYSPDSPENPSQLISKVVEDDESGGQNASKVSFVAVAGTTYHFAVDGRYGAGGVCYLNLNFSESSPPLNDDFLSATRLGGSPIRVSVDSSASSAESNEPRHAGQPAARSVWWYWAPDYDGPVRISTEGSSFDTILAIYTGSALDNLRKVVSNDDSTGAKTSALEFQAAKGNIYYIAVDGHDISGGKVDLQISQSSTPLNDHFANRATLVGNEVNISSSNVMATNQDGEPAHSGLKTSKSLWWQWKADYTAPVRISTGGSDFDTVLAVYSGGEVGLLKPIVSNNNDANGLTSVVWFQAEQGKTYQIAVAANTDAGGSLQFSLSQDDEGVAYQTGFDLFPVGKNALNGIDGWMASDSGEGTSGIFEVDGGADLEGWIGLHKAEQNKVTLQRIVNLPRNSAVVEFGIDLSIEDSSEGRLKDEFSCEIVNIGTEGKLLAGILFDNATGKILRLDGVGRHDTGATFAKSSIAPLDAIINLPENNWSVYFNGKPLFENQPFSMSQHERNIGGFNLAWKPANPAKSGDNYMAFDNYWIATSRTAPLISSSDSSQTSLGGDFQYQIEASDNPGRYMAYDLPPGLSCDPATGQISGKPEKAGSYDVMLTAAANDAIGSKMLKIDVQ
ncbi:MAG: putative Ig domain-containing protein [Spartobacteria bacterium]